MRTIILYGELGKRFGRVHKFAVSNVAEAIKALKVNHKGFTEYLAKAHLEGFGFHLRTGSYSLESNDELSAPSGLNDVIRIIPAVMGSGGLFKVFLGAALVAGGFIVSAGSAGGLTPLGTAMVSAGAGLLIGGVSQLLTGIPQTPTTTGANNKTSYLFSGPVNSSAQGGAVPIGYGRLMIGSVVISAGINTA